MGTTSVGYDFDTRQAPAQGVDLLNDLRPQEELASLLGDLGLVDHCRSTRPCGTHRGQRVTNGMHDRSGSSVADLRNAGSWHGQSAALHRSREVPHSNCTLSRAPSAAVGIIAPTLLRRRGRR